MRTLLLVAVLAATGCPVTSGRPGGPGGQTGGSVDANACGRIDTTDAGRKVYAFLLATQELQREVAELEASARGSCKVMATELGIPAEGDTVILCKAVSEELKRGLAASLKADARFEVAYTPAVCTVNVDAAAKIAAECQGSATATADVTCDGQCTGTCKGRCDGQCAATAASGECAGACEGTCEGSCSGGCEGTADVQADVECEAAAEVRANIEAECTTPELEMRFDAGLVVDQARLDRVRSAISKGLPGLLTVAAKLTGPVAGATVTWTQSVSSLYKATGKLFASLGPAATCVIGQIGAAFEAAASIEVQVSITVQASVEVGGSAGASAH
jgi:hypothetical protein